MATDSSPTDKVRGPPPQSFSITIPTKNAASSLKRCLDSVLEQKLAVELIVADDCSTDGTRELARSLGAQVLAGPLPLLEARYQAFRQSTGDAVLMLDADQVLQPGTLLRCLEMLRTHDVLVLEEFSLNTDVWLGRLFQADRRLLHELAPHHLDPSKGTLLPRAFRRSVLEHAFRLIPETIRSVAIAQDHAIIYDAVGNVTGSIGLVPHAVGHEEMVSLREMWRKYFRWGAGLVELFALCPRYRDLTKSTVAARLHIRGARRADAARSLTLLILKLVPYSLGYFYARVVHAWPWRPGRPG